MTADEALNKLPEKKGPSATDALATLPARDQLHKFQKVMPYLAQAAGPLTGGVIPSAAAQVLVDPEKRKVAEESSSLPMRGLRGLGVTAASGLQRGADAVSPEFDPQGLKENAADLAANVADPRMAIAGLPIGEAMPLINKGANVLGRTAARAVNIATGVPAEDVRAVANQPIKALLAKTRNEAGKIFGAAKKAAGVTSDEERTIAGIGDPSGFKRVADVFHKQAQRKGIDKLSVGNLLSWQKAASQLSRKSVGSAEAIYAQDANKVQQELTKRAADSPEVSNLLKTKEDAALSIARSKFGSIFPRNKGKGDAVLRSTIQGGMGAAGALGLGNPLQALALAPAAYFAPTVAAGAAGKGLNVLGSNPAIRQTLLGLLSKLKGDGAR